MVEIKEIRPTNSYKKDIKKYGTLSYLEEIERQINKIRKNPKTGKPLRKDLSGAKSTRVERYRLIFRVDGNVLWLLRFRHRKKVYI